MKKYIKAFFVSLVVLLVTVACSREDNGNNDLNSEASDSNQVQVVTSIFPVYEITKEIAGENADVSLMVEANDDAHHYEPSAQAVASVNEADIFIYSSDVMEFWAESLLAVNENSELEIVELAEGLDLSFGETVAEESHADHDHEHEHEDHDHHHDHDHGGLDPHFWVDPVAVNQQLELIVDALISVDPEGEENYRENAENFSIELNELDSAYQEAFKGVANRDFVVQHQAFGHLANRYDLNQIAVSGLTTEVEADPQQLSEVVDFVNAQGVPVVYYQSGENSNIAETIALETGTETATLYDLENKPEGIETENGLYLEAMYYNLKQLKKTIQ